MALATLLLGALFTVPANLVNAEVTTHPASLERAASQTRDGWIAFEYPMNKARSGPCCWRGSWQHSQVGCRLDRSHTGITFGDGERMPRSSIAQVYLEVRDGEPRRMQIANSSCPVDGGGAAVNWIEAVDPSKTLRWLTAMLDDHRGDIPETALQAIALHRDDSVADLLYDVAVNRRGDLGEQAVFWLGESRGPAGFRQLARLLEELPRGDRRRRINFALSENDTPEAADLLLRISQEDRDAEQRADALFWLAEGYPARALPVIKAALSESPDEEIRERAVFALSQLPDEVATQALLDVVRGPYPREVRRQALFWLAESDDPAALEALEKLLAAD